MCGFSAALPYYRRPSRGLTGHIPRYTMLAVACSRTCFRDFGGAVMSFTSKNSLASQRLYWISLGVAILVTLVTACTILCLLDIPPRYSTLADVAIKVPSKRTYRSVRLPIVSGWRSLTNAMHRPAIIACPANRI
jgi:hypothetical protein